MRGEKGWRIREQERKNGWSEELGEGVFDERRYEDSGWRGG